VRKRIVAIVPVRSLRNGKSRLAPALDPQAREALLREMAERVVGAATASGVVAATLVVSPDVDALRWAAELDGSVIALPQPRELPGLNGAIDAGRRWALAHDAEAVLSLFADLPFLAAEDVRHLAARAEPVVLGADRRGEGTNALLLRLAWPGSAFEFAFGAGSLGKHLAEADRLGLAAAVECLPGVGFDLDTPEDWADYLDMATEPGAESLVSPAPCGVGAG
jgi:2-phospho-L-lactate guanylyltransferase